jgi:hypothetical protein
MVPSDRRRVAVAADDRTCLPGLAISVVAKASARPCVVSQGVEVDVPGQRERAADAGIQRESSGSAPGRRRAKERLENDPVAAPGAPDVRQLPGRIILRSRTPSMGLPDPGEDLRGADGSPSTGGPPRRAGPLRAAEVPRDDCPRESSGTMIRRTRPDQGRDLLLGNGQTVRGRTGGRGSPRRAPHPPPSSRSARRAVGETRDLGVLEAVCSANARCPPGRLHLAEQPEFIGVVRADAFRGSRPGRGVP